MWWWLLALGCGQEIADTGEPEAACVPASVEVQAALDEAVHAWLADGDEAVLDPLDAAYADLCFDAFASAIRAWPGEPLVATAEPVELSYELPLLGTSATAWAWVPLSAEESGQERVPLVVWLYGSGGNSSHEVTNPPLRDAVAPLEAMLLVPSAVACDWAAYDPCAEQVHAAIAAAKAAYPVDHDRVYLAGHSMGGRGTLTDGLAWPDRFAGLVPVAGSVGVIPNTDDRDFHELLLRPHVENALHLRTRMLTGMRDIEHLVLQNEIAAELFEEYDYDFQWDALEDLGHDMPWPEWTTALHWTAEAVRDPYPDQVIYNMARLASSEFDYLYLNPEIGSSVWWVRVDARVDDQAPARVEGTIEGQTMAITTENVAELSVYLADELVDLDEAVTIEVNGAAWFEGEVGRDPVLALDHARENAERSMVFAARVTAAVP